MLDWIKKHRILFVIVCVIISVALFGVPFLIHLLFKVNIKAEILQAEWSAGEFLGYYGAVLSFIGTVVLGALALYQNHIIKAEADKKAAILEEQERIENMPKFHMRNLGASGFCGSLRISINNVSNNIAYDVDVYDIKIKAGSKTIWESQDTYASPVINPQKNIVLNLKSPASNEKGEVVLYATMSCKDKYYQKHEYLMKMVCRYPNDYSDSYVTEI